MESCRYGRDAPSWLPTYLSLISSHHGWYVQSLRILDNSRPTLTSSLFHSVSISHVPSAHGHIRLEDHRRSISKGASVSTHLLTQAGSEMPKSGQSH